MLCESLHTRVDVRNIFSVNLSVSDTLIGLICPGFQLFSVLHIILYSSQSHEHLLWSFVDLIQVVLGSGEEMLELVEQMFYS